MDESKSEALVDEDLAAMMERCEAASGESWTRFYDSYDDKTWLISAGPPYCDATIIASSIPEQSDAEFIAHAREDLPRVIKELVATRAENERWKGIAQDNALLLDEKLAEIARLKEAVATQRDAALEDAALEADRFLEKLRGRNNDRSDGAFVAITRLARNIRSFIGTPVERPEATP